MPRRFLILFPRAELRGWSAVTPGGEKWAVHPHSSALGWNLENRLGIVVCINQETIHGKFQLSTIPQLGCRWGRSVLGGASFSKLGTSVDKDSTWHRFERAGDDLESDVSSDFSQHLLNRIHRFVHHVYPVQLTNFVAHLMKDE